MALAPVTQARINIAKAFGLQNVDVIAKVCREVGIPFYAACALFEKESKGRNCYGNDKDGALSGYPGEVDESNFAVFRWLILNKEMVSNGVGPAQITWKGYFAAMESQGLKPWIVTDNMRFGLGLLLDHYNRHGKSWFEAGKAYNGSAEYGRDLEQKVLAWKKRLQ